MMGTKRIAIVGMACRYPDANSPVELWQTVLGRRRAFRSIPETRLSSDYLGEPDDPDRTYVTQAGLLRDWEFDRPRFGVPGSLYRAADQSHWLALQVAAEALADAGFPDGEGLDRDQAGVVLGNSLTGEFSRSHQLRLRWPFVHRAAAAALEGSGADTVSATKALTRLEELIKQPFPVPGDETLAGALANTIAGRICNQFDFHGTGYTVDGACASSLLAVMTAGRALITGELDFALAGGVDLSLDPFELVGFARLGALAVDEMRIYDASPTGFLPGEGCGVIAMMRADDAERAGLRCYAELVGWGTSSDGAGGLTRPEASGQSRAMARAYRMSGIDPRSVDLIEGHGTGTQVGDATELTVLRTVFADRARPAALGSIKANIGHTKAAAGVAGLIKAALAVHHRVLPPTTGCATPHELLRGSDTPVRILSEPEPWDAIVPRAAVSAMGFGGINTHIVLSGEAGEPAGPLSADVRAWSRPRATEEIVTLGGETVAELAEQLDRVVDNARSLSTAELHDVAATAARTPIHLSAARCAMVVRTPAELAFVAAKARKRLTDGDIKVVVDNVGFALGVGTRGRTGLLFPGQAAPVRAKLAVWPAAVHVPDLPDGVHLTDGTARTAIAQPAIVRQSLAGLAWLGLLGCRPVAAAGHSLGEISALVWAGVLTPQAGLALSAARGALMERHGGTGTVMAGLRADRTTASSLIKGTHAVIAALNSPRQTTIAGPEADVVEVIDRARQQDINATMLPVSHGFHSPAMEPVAAPFRAALAHLGLGKPAKRVFSTVSGDELDQTTDLAELLVEQLVLPVRFQETATRLAQLCDLLVEVGPGTTLAGLIGDSGITIPAVSMDCGDPRRHAIATAALVAAGGVGVGPWYGDGGHRTLDLDRPPVLLTNPCETLPAVGVPATRPSAPAKPVRQEPPPTSGTDSLSVLREHLSRSLELPPDSIEATSSLLSDLHLSSLQVLDLVTTVAELLGRQAPSPNQVMNNPSVAELARMIDARPLAIAGQQLDTPGVRHWIRTFAHRWVRHDEPHPALDDVVWTRYTPDARITQDAPPSAPRTEGVRRGLIIELREASDLEHTIGEISSAIRRVSQERPEFLVVLHDAHPAAAGLARSVAVELADCAVTVVDRPQGHDFDLTMAAESGYLELRVGEQQDYERPTTELHRARGEAPHALAAGDVCLVTGGTAGVTARCAAALAERYGATLVFLGRSPADSPKVSNGLNRLPQHIRVHYIRCDVTDPADVRAAVSAAATCGPIRGLLHGAGVNDPRLLGDVIDTSLRDTLRPKVAGLRLLLDAVGSQTRLVVAFGSIIGRMGMAGQAEYCIANDWMRDELEVWAAKPESVDRWGPWPVWT